MKSRFLSKTGKKAILAIPAAALMLGASHAGVVGINYTVNWGDKAANGNGTDPGTYGTTGYYSYGYMTTGFNVTATAFGVPAANWTGIQVVDDTNNVTNVIGAMTVVTTSKGASCSGIGNTNYVYSDWYSTFEPAGVVPGTDQVTWGYLDDDTKIPGTNYNTINYVMWNVQLSGMKAAHPNGYTIQTINYPWIFDTTRTPSAPDVNISDLATFTNKLTLTDLGARQGAWGQNISHPALSSVSPVLTNDVINIFGDPPWIPTQYLGIGKNEQRVHSTLNAFIITDASSVAPLTLQIVGKNAVWSAGTLQSSTNITVGTNTVWTTLSNAVSPYPILPSSAPQMFYRLKQ